MNASSMSVTRRSLAVLFCGAAMAAGTCMAQTDAPQPPPDGAQGPPSAMSGPRHGGPDRRVEMLQRQLDLTPEQVTQVRSLLETEQSKMEALHANSASLSREDMHTQMMAIHQDGDTKLRALLTTDQVTKYNAIQARMRERMQERRDDGQGPPAPPTSGNSPQQK
ncbi:MAG: Spy/CpxP family protein refolding chaperone [Janthinobacterium lividum]